LTKINLSGRIAKSFGNRNEKLEKYMNTIKDLLKEDESTDGKTTGDGSTGDGSTGDGSKEDGESTEDESSYDEITKLGVLFANFLVSSTIYDSDIKKSEELKKNLKEKKEENKAETEPEASVAASGTKPGDGES